MAAIKAKMKTKENLARAKTRRATVVSIRSCRETRLKARGRQEGVYGRNRGAAAAAEYHRVINVDEKEVLRERREHCFAVSARAYLWRTEAEKHNIIKEGENIGGAQRRRYAHGA